MRGVSKPRAYAPGVPSFAKWVLSAHESENQIEFKMKPPLIRSLTVFIKINAVNNHVNNLLIYDALGQKHEMLIPNSPTVHSFIADILAIRSIGLAGVIDAEQKVIDTIPKA